MRIGIDCRTISDANFKELGGIGHYTYYLVHKLIELDDSNQYFLFFYNKEIDVSQFDKPNVKCVVLPGVRYKKFFPFFYNHLFVPQILRFYHLDIYHNPANIIPLFYMGKSVITVHDLAIYKNPAWFPRGQWFSRHILVPLSIKRAKKIIAVSESTRNDLINIFKIIPDKIKVIYEGVGFDKRLLNDSVSYKPSDKFKNLGRYFLYVGTLEPRKNLVRVIQAYHNFLNKFPDENINFVIAGRRGWKYDDIFNAIEQYGLQDKIIMFGYINPLEKIYLMKNAFTFIFTSLYEGFGLPILESMLLGAPIITSNISSIPEIIIDNAVLVDPYNVGDIEAGMEKLTFNSALREKLIQRGQEIAKNYTWTNCGQDTIKVYSEIF